MNAFTQKPDLSKFLKSNHQMMSGKKSGIMRAKVLGGQIVPGMGNADRSKVAIKPNAPRP